MSLSVKEQKILDAYHKLYYWGPDGERGRTGIEGRGTRRLTWFGKPLLKCPNDLLIYQEIIYETKPTLIIETGTHMGGSALFFAHILDLIGQGEVVTIDRLIHPGRPKHPRIRYIAGSSSDQAVIDTIPLGKDPVLVVLDADHRKAHVLKELDLLAPYVKVGGYLVVEDTNANGHPVIPDHGDGPWEALVEWLPQHPEFMVDKSREKLLLTFNPGGFLRRIR